MSSGKVTSMLTDNEMFEVFRDAANSKAMSDLHDWLENGAVGTHVFTYIRSGTQVHALLSAFSVGHSTYMIFENALHSAHPFSSPFIYFGMYNCEEGTLYDTSVSGCAPSQSFLDTDVAKEVTYKVKSKLYDAFTVLPEDIERPWYFYTSDMDGYSCFKTIFPTDSSYTPAAFLINRLKSGGYSKSAFISGAHKDFRYLVDKNIFVPVFAYIGILAEKGTDYTADKCLEDFKEICPDMFSVALNYLSAGIQFCSEDGDVQLEVLGRKIAQRVFMHSIFACDIIVTLTGNAAWRPVYIPKGTTRDDWSDFSFSKYRSPYSIDGRSNVRISAGDFLSILIAADYGKGVLSFGEEDVSLVDILRITSDDGTVLYPFSS